MSSLFETYEKQYGNLTCEITLNLGKIPQLKNDDRPRVVRETSLLFDETKDLIEQMSLEVQEVPQNMKEKYRNRLQCFRTELDKLSTEFRKPRYAPRGGPEARKSYKIDDDDDMLREDVLYDSDMRARLLDNTERVSRSTVRLDDGVRVALQTEDIGSNILQDLSEQREKLQRSRNRLHQADSDLSKSSRILTDMTRRIMQNRIVLIGIIFFVVLIIVFALYLALKPNAVASLSIAPAVPSPVVAAAAAATDTKASVGKHTT